MRRSGLTKVCCFEIDLILLSVFLLALTIPLPAAARADQTDTATNAVVWPQANLEGLDQRVQELVDRPAPASLSDAPLAATPEATSGLEGMLLVGPRRSLESAVPTAPPPATAAAAPEPLAVPVGPVPAPNAAASSTLLSPAATAAQDVDSVFGDVMDEVSPSEESGPSELEPRMADRLERSAPALAEPRMVEPQAPARTISPPSIPPHVAPLQSMIEQCLQVHAPLRLNSAHDSCWSMMHAFLGWGPTCEIHIGGPRGPRTNAVTWIAQNQPCGGRRLFYLEGNRIRGRQGPGYQGHPAQFLAMLAQCRIDPRFSLSVNDRTFALADLIEEEKRTCTSSTELTFKLMGLVHYLGTKATWTNDAGEPWDIEKILAIELAQPVNGAACGGTHRLMAISFAVAKRREEGQPLDGHWWRAEKYVADYHAYTLTLQNRDGSFSSDWFRQRADWGDMNRRVQTTGHILEWLAYSLPDEMLYDPRVVSAVHYLTRTMIQHRYHDWEVGPKGHAIRALRLYHQRVFEPLATGAAPMAGRTAGAEATR